MTPPEDDHLREVIRQELERCGLDPGAADQMRADMVSLRRNRVIAERLGMVGRVAVLATVLAFVFEAVRAMITGSAG